MINVIEITEDEINNDSIAYFSQKVAFRDIARRKGIDVNRPFTYWHDDELRRFMVQQEIV